jgi:hypothetical protein
MNIGTCPHTSLKYTPVDTGDVEKPIVCLVRHLSPVGRLLSRSAFDFVMRRHPAAAVEASSNEDKHELLKVEIGEYSSI